MLKIIAATMMMAQGAMSLFDGAVGWINTDKPIHMDDLKGKIVLVDFWTYCCINCLHTLPILAKMEEKFPNELVVIGVHSAKFKTEKSTDSIREAVLRYDIKHPVANDADFQIWRRVGVKAWPTLLMLDPEGQPVGMNSGEPNEEQLEGIILDLIAKHRANGTLNETPMTWPLAAESAPDSVLSYPGKILVDTEGERLFVSDTSHNRVLVCGLDGEVQMQIGSGKADFRGGDFADACLNGPQGLALDGDKLYIADQKNHAVRIADLAETNVSTLSGNGFNGSAETMAAGLDIRLSSPWDLLIKGDKLYVAMAGSHQIWEMNKKNGYLQLFAGSGRENLKDSFRQGAQLAQPSGLSISEDALYFADSEVSAVRRASFEADGNVETLIGKGLFDFGDTDGPAQQARLQHCLGVAYSPEGVYIADTYNHKIKLLDLKTMEVSTLLGTGQPGKSLGATVELHEPNDVKVVGKTLYIADTNNHRILKHNLASGVTEEIVIRMDGESEATKADAQTLAPGAATLEINLKLPEGTKFNPDAPFSVDVESVGAGIKVLEFDGDTAAAKLSVPLEVSAGATLRVNIAAPYCAVENAKVCAILLEEIEVPIIVETGAASQASLTFTALELATGSRGK